MAKLQISGALQGRVFLGLFVVLFLLGTLLDAQAQMRRRGPQLTPEKQTAVQELEAKYVAKSLKLSDEATKKLVTVYQKARTNLQEAVQALPDSSDYQAYREIIVKKREKLEKELKGFLDEKQTEKAIKYLGTFSTSWDRMVDTLAGFKLGEKKLYEALGKVEVYLNESAEARGSGDRQTMRTKLQEIKVKLDGALKSLLSEKEMEQWMEATTRRRRN